MTRRKEKTIEQQVAVIESEIADIARLWEKRGRKAHKGFKRAKKGFLKARKDFKIAKAEGRDPVTLTRHFAGQARQMIHPHKSIYKIPKKGIGSKLTGLFKKKRKGIY